MGAHIKTICLILLVSGLATTVIDAHVSSTNITGIHGTVRGYNVPGDLLPIAGALVEARQPSTGQFISSIQTQADGYFSLPLSPGDYNLTVSAPPPASNISPASVVGQALAYITPSVVSAVAGVNVTLSPRFPERDVGDWCLTDSYGFFNLTVWPYYLLKSYSMTVRVPEGTDLSVDVNLEATVPDQAEPSIFYITFNHPEYPAGPEYPLDHTLKIMLGQSYSFEGYMNTWPPVTATVTFEGNQYTIGVNGYSYSSPPAWNLRFDAKRRLFNFTMGESYLPQGVAEFVVLIHKQLLDGSPVVLVDNAVVPSVPAQNSSHYFIRFSYMLASNKTVTHDVMVGGSNTIPEITSPLVSLAAVMFLCLFSRRKPKAERTTMRVLF